MMKIFDEFAAICKKYGLKKNEATYQLFACFYEVAEYMKIGQYEKNEFSFLEAARLISVLRHGTSIEVTSANGKKMKLENPILKASLIMYLNTEINRESEGYYTSAGLVGEKQEISSGRYEGVLFTGGDFTEPYTDHELNEIISFEKEKQEWHKQLRGRAGADVPKLGYYIMMFLIQAPAVFGDYCGDAEPLMKQTDQFNLIGDLLNLAGVFKEIKGNEWIEDNWEVWTTTERAHTLKDWLASYEKISAKRMSEERYLFGKADMSLSGGNRKSTAIMSKASIAARELHYWKDKEMKKLFEELEL